jgi:hypothetical protein
MSKRDSGANSEPGQPLLPRINLAQLLLASAVVCECDCEYCPPWEHRHTDVLSRSVPSDRPPRSNTGVHASTNRGSGDSTIRERHTIQNRAKPK